MSVSSPPRALLQWKATTGTPRQLRLAAKRTLIGRRADADVVLDDRLVSRRHAEIVQEGDAWVVLDLGSTHGTFVNGQRIQQQPLSPRDRIQLGGGGVEILFCHDNGQGAPAEPSGERTIVTQRAATLLESDGVHSSVQRLADVLPEHAGRHSELEKIASLLDFHYYFGKAFSAEKTFEQILRSALQISGAERGFVLRKQAVGFCYALGLDHAGRTLPEADFRTSTSVVEQVAATGEPVFMTQGISDNLAAQNSIVAMNLRAVACLPLETVPDESDATLNGILYLDSRKLMHSLSVLDEKLLRRLAGEAGNVLGKVQLIDSLAESRRIERELATAEETQRTLLPFAVPEFAPYTIRAFCKATRHLGGDFYDFLPVGEDLVCLLGDVSGKGIPAALLASLALGALNMQFRASADPAEVMHKTNGLLFQKIPSNRFVTLFLVRLAASGEGHFLSAGHNTAYLFRGATGELEELRAGGLPLGMFAEARYECFPFALTPGDVLVIYSDGLTDAENPAGDDFGEERLQRLIRALGPSGVEPLRAGLMAELNEFTDGATQNDDITFLLVGHSGRRPSSAPVE